MWGEWILWGAIAALLCAGAITDVRFRRVPDMISYAVILLGGGFAILQNEVFWLHFTGGLCAFLFLGIPAFLGQGIGGADVKLSAGLGLFWGFPDILEVLLTSFLLGIVFWGAARCMGKRKDQTIPLVPFMGIAHIVFWIMFV